MSAVEPMAEHRRPNLYRAALIELGEQVQDALRDLGADGGTPLRWVTEGVATSWTADPSRIREDFLEDLHEADRGWRAALLALGDEARSEAEPESPDIDVVNDPGEAWKTREMHSAPVSRGRAV